MDPRRDIANQMAVLKLLARGTDRVANQVWTKELVLPLQLYSPASR